MYFWNDQNSTNYTKDATFFSREHPSLREREIVGNNETNSY